MVYSTERFHCIQDSQLGPNCVRYKEVHYIFSSTLPAQPLLSCLQPALSAYQRKKDLAILKDEMDSKAVVKHLEPSNKKSRPGQVEPLNTGRVSELPDLPDELLERQKSLTNLRKLTPSPPLLPSPLYTPHPPVSRNQSSMIRPKRSSMLRQRSSHARPSTTLLDPDERIATSGPVPLESLRDPLDVVERLKAEPELGFLYMMPVYGRHSSKYNPYYVK